MPSILTASLSSYWNQNKMVAKVAIGNKHLYICLLYKAYFEDRIQLVCDYSSKYHFSLSSSMLKLHIQDHVSKVLNNIQDYIYFHLKSKEGNLYYFRPSQINAAKPCSHVAISIHR